MGHCRPATAIHIFLTLYPPACLGIKPVFLSVDIFPHGDTSWSHNYALRATALSSERTGWTGWTGGRRTSLLGRLSSSPGPVDMPPPLMG